MADDKPDLSASDSWVPDLLDRIDGKLDVHLERVQTVLLDRDRDRDERVNGALNRVTAALAAMEANLELMRHEVQGTRLDVAKLLATVDELKDRVATLEQRVDQLETNGGPPHRPAALQAARQAARKR